MAPLDATGRVLWFTPSSAAVAAAAAVCRPGARPDNSQAAANESPSAVVAQTPVKNTVADKSTSTTTTTTSEDLLTASSLSPWSVLSTPSTTAATTLPPATTTRVQSTSTVRAPATTSSSTAAATTTTIIAARAMQSPATSNATASVTPPTRSDSTTASARGGRSTPLTADAKLAQTDALSVYGPGFYKILCANPRGRSLKKIVEMKALQLKRRQDRKTQCHTQCNTPHTAQHSAGASTAAHRGSIDTTASPTAKAALLPNDQLVTPRLSKSVRGTVHSTVEPSIAEAPGDDDGDDDEEDDEEDLDADWVKEMLAQMEGECYYGDMPFELLHLVFGNFLRVSMESLKQLAERKRTQLMAVKAAERELEDRWAKTPLLPVDTESIADPSQKRRFPRACNVCQCLQYDGSLSLTSSAAHLERQRHPYLRRRHTSSTTLQQQEQRPSSNTMRNRLPPIGRQFSAHSLASSPPSSGYTSTSSSDTPNYTIYSDESDSNLADERGNRSELDSDVYSGEEDEDEDTEDIESLGHPTHQGELEDMDDLVASLEIGDYPPSYNSDDVDNRSLDSTDAMEHEMSDQETRSRPTVVYGISHTMAATEAPSLTGHATSNSFIPSTSVTAPSTMAGYTNAGRDGYRRRFRYRHHRRYLQSELLDSDLNPSTSSGLCHCNCKVHGKRSESIHPWSNGQRNFRKAGINRVGDDQDEETTLHELYRDQYFHPVTHIALRSDLYLCSLVNRQWRLAALQLMWQSVVLDAESCQLELPVALDCTCHLSSHSPRISDHRSDSPLTYSTSSVCNARLKSRSSSSTGFRSRSCKPVQQPPLLMSSQLMTSSSSCCCSSSSSASSSTTSPRISQRRRNTPPRTRIETMLDSYLQLYSLDLAKSVQTVELDLQILASWSSGNSGNAINLKRILQRLAPFNHLRLVSAERPSSSEGEIAANFRFVMEEHYNHIRHLHFSPGFAIGRVWVQEMDRMPVLEKLTIESLNSMERVDFDWSRIRVLVLHAIVPSSLFGNPRPVTISSIPPTPPPTPQATNENGGPAGSGTPTLLPVTAPASLNSIVSGESTVDNGSMTTDLTLPVNAGTLASPHPFFPVDPASTILNSLQSTSTLVVGTPHGTFFHLYSTSPSSSLLTFMPSSYAHPNLPQYLLNHPMTKFARQPRPGWWLWNGLRRLEIQIKNVVLPREWLQELVAVLSHRARAEQDLIQMHDHEANTLRRPAGHLGTNSFASSSGSKFEEYREQMLEERLRNAYGLGPRIEVFHLDCEVSHPHRDILMDLMTHWGHRLREFHFSQSAELTDEFFWCCLQRGKNLRRLSLRDSRGITGEGVDLNDHQHPVMLDQSSSVLSSREESRHAKESMAVKTGSLDPTATDAVKADHGDSHDRAGSSSKDETRPRTTRATPRVVIGWRRDFEELRLDQSRVRSECLVALKQHCPGMKYKVRDVRWSNGQRKSGLLN